jgi:hypothetical protein
LGKCLDAFEAGHGLVESGLGDKGSRDLVFQDLLLFAGIRDSRAVDGTGRFHRGSPGWRGGNQPIRDHLLKQLAVDAGADGRTGATSGNDGTSCLS